MPHKNEHAMTHVARRICVKMNVCEYRLRSTVLPNIGVEFLLFVSTEER